MGALRFATDCVTGQRIWRWYASVGRPQHSTIWPCAKAAVVGLPLALGPSVFVPGAAPAAVAPVPPAPPAWHEGAGPLYWLPTNGENSSFAPSATAITPFVGLFAPVLPGVPPGEFSSFAPRTDQIPPLSTPASLPGIPSSEISPPGVRTDVPEPGTLAVVMVGAGAAVLVRRRRA